MGFLFGVVVGAFACYVILRAGINIGRRALLTIAIVVLAVMFIGGLLTFAITFPVTYELTQVREMRHEIPWPECIEERVRARN